MLCCCCGSTRPDYSKVLWDELIHEWRLSNYEAAYIERQQGLRCAVCCCNLRSMALAKAIMSCFGYGGLLKDFARGPAMQTLQILEVNEAGDLTQFLAQLPGHVLRCYPDIDMMAIPYTEASFDLVIHSDTLEHVPDPVRGLAECARVLKPGGYCAFTVPIVVDRLTVSREGLPASHHGSRERPADCLVYTEYGADAWKQVIQAGFQQCRLLALEYPAALALVAVKSALQEHESIRPGDDSEQLPCAVRELAEAIPPGKEFILVDDNQLGSDLTGERRGIPFMEHNGVYWGNPENDCEAIRELDRLRQAGANFIVFAWSAFWWRSCYRGLQRYLRSRFRCVLENDRLLVFDLTSS
jgi:hypothetical protein